ncbi:hypothetical protein MGYG_08607 [Nannizzia gypsea CBS 118893]|uniref:Uncharacterized protein n=1 Tax=Arthroderma gypseum (strain ATCC MYA-4604 / CBS 118893) TaxID=535722 RepID=E4V6G8_ARTGP|nr:hypothetical protein MGYG_08607 [Nannizzia gypsea CBS 118893]EFQ96684.1 hypothetical protein MGYG_08607 [Nannizzia gypsea CBS 118893]
MDKSGRKEKSGMVTTSQDLALGWCKKQQARQEVLRKAASASAPARRPLEDENYVRDYIIYHMMCNMTVSKLRHFKEKLKQTCEDKIGKGAWRAVAT